MQFPPFEHLHFYERLRGRFLNISFSDMREFPLREFHREFPMDIDTVWVDLRGMPDLRKRIAKRHGVDPDRVLVTNGATEANFLVNAALVRPGDRVVVDLPMYSPLRDCPVGLGARVVPVARDCSNGWALDMRALRKALRGGARLLVFANLANPTSSAISRGELRELADLAAEAGAYVLVDETFREMGFSKAPPSVANLGPHMIAISTVTKLFGLGALRVGWVVADPEVLEKAKAVKDYTTAATSVVSQVIATWALQRHGFFVRRAKTITDENRRILRDAIERMPALHGEVPEVGNLYFPHSDVDVTALEQRLLTKHRTVIAHGRFFGTQDHFRIGLGGDSGVFRRGLSNVRRVLHELT
ncbi:MAG TPA: pyridoxal phosphate-dependent aminotransferase [Thermoplasmata archaeon]|nr:pyridoxal phosphate-dependent aminotransferase [Thermoplasmata archaeon]